MSNLLPLNSAISRTPSLSFASSCCCFRSPLYVSSLPIPSQMSSSFRILSSPSHPSVSSDDYDVVSAIECSDGSIVFQFGDSSEIAKNVKVNTLAPEETELQGVGKQTTSGSASKEEAKSNSDIIERESSLTDVVVDSVNERAVHDEDSGEMGQKLLNDISDIEFISDKILIPFNQSEHDDFLKGETGNGKDDVATLAPHSVTDVVLREDGLDETVGMSSLFVPSSGVEKSNSFPFKHSGQENESVEVTDFSGGSSDHNSVCKESKQMTDCDNDAIEVLQEFTSVNVEPILDEENINNALDVPTDASGIESTKVLDSSLTSSNWEEETLEVDAESKSYEVISNPHVEELQTAGSIMNKEETLMKGFFLLSGAAVLPHPLKALTGGEDAYFIDENWVGIVDGVKLWSLEGVDAVPYAHELIKNCQKIVCNSKSISITDPVEILTKAAMETQCPGSSTALVAYFDGQTFHVANIGDSGFFILRNGTIFKKSSPMVQELNYPIQIEMGDNPSELLETYKIHLDEGDVIITATDGLFDNLYEQEIASTVSKSLKAGLKPQQIAELLAMKAQEVGRSALVRSPFADGAQAAGYVGYTGGRLDDVTIIVSLVQNRSTFPF